MADVTTELLKAQLRQLRLPTMGREFEKLARDAAASNQTFAQFLLRLTEIELATRGANAVTARFPLSFLHWLALRRLWAAGPAFASDG